MTDLASSPEAPEPPATKPRRLPKDPITRWLLMVSGLIILMISVGGFVRLSRAGLSIVEWDVVTGTLPPIGETAWQEAFDEYRQTPEYQLVNAGMTLSEFQRIYYYEWGHRLIARLAGLAVVAPLVWFMWKRRVSFRESIRYWAVAALFGLQGAIGWIMVSSGLRDRPAVSEFRLTIHLLIAVLLLAMTVWMALDRIRAAREESGEVAPSRSLTMSWVLLGAIVVQIGFGGLVAGLKAGHVSTTWPLMFGQFLPASVLGAASTWWESLIEPVGAHWVHRWLAIVVLGIAVALISRLRRTHSSDRAVTGPTVWLTWLLLTQIGLGVLTVLTNVSKWIALAHQACGILTFVAALVIVHRVRTRPEAVTV